jgi:hypothetical protein
MKARQLLFRYKDRQGNFIVERVIWTLAAVTEERPHALKYRLFCGRPDACVVRYDHEGGKGDHRHYGDREESYHFESLERLLDDFRQDCARLAGGRWE